MSYTRQDRRNFQQENRRNILLRDNYRCIFCKSKGVHVHEVIPRSALGRNMSEFLFSERNSVCLCVSCHEKAHTRKERTKAYGYLKQFGYIYTEKEIDIIQKFTGE